MNEARNNFELEQVKLTLDRILGHQVEFKSILNGYGEKLDAITEIVNSEEKNRMIHVHEIKDQLHNRINTILFSVLGGAVLFIGGIIMWALDKKT